MEFVQQKLHCNNTTISISTSKNSSVNHLSAQDFQSFSCNLSTIRVAKKVTLIFNYNRFMYYIDYGT